MKKLIIIDMQVGFTTGSLANPAAVAIIPNIKKVIDYARKNNWEIIYTRDTHDAELYPQTSEGKHLPVPHCIKGTDDWQIVKELTPKENDKIIDKETFGYGGWFDGILDRTDEVYMCGTVTSICVISNSLAIKQGLFNEVNIVEDACAGLSKEDHDAAIKVMATCHCNITKVNEVVGE